MDQNGSGFPFKIRKSAVFWCCVPGCRSKYRLRSVEQENGGGFFIFPRPDKQQTIFLQRLAEQRLIQWKQAVGSDVRAGSRICYRHFLAGKPARLTSTTDVDWVPTRHLKYEMAVSPQSILQDSSIVHVDLITGTSSNLRDSTVSYAQEQNSMCLDADFHEETEQPESLEKAKRAKRIRKRNATVQASALVRSTATQTDEESETEVRTLQAQVKRQAELISELERRIRKTKVNLQTLRENPSDIKYYTGLGSYTAMQKIYDSIEPFLLTPLNLTKEEVLLMSLQKLRHDATYKSLAIAYDISPTTSAKYFLSTVYTMYTVFYNVVHWPDRETLRKHTPQCFRDLFGDTITTIIDCFEIKGERPSNLVGAAQQWSEYKKSCTEKYLIAISSAGYIMFVSEGFGGRASDKNITQNSGFLDHIQEGDIVMGDRGFLIENELQKKNATMCIPAFRKTGGQLLAIETERTRNVANVRIHVERIIGNLRNKYRIIKERVPMTMVVRDHNGQMLMDMIVRVAAILVNLCPEIIH